MLIEAPRTTVPWRMGGTSAVALAWRASLGLIIGQEGTMAEHDHSHDHPHDHGHYHDHPRLSELQLRVKALESLLVEKGLVDPAALDVFIDLSLIHI